MLPCVLTFHLLGATHSSAQRLRSPPSPELHSFNSPFYKAERDRQSPIPPAVTPSPQSSQPWERLTTPGGFPPLRCIGHLQRAHSHETAVLPGPGRAEGLAPTSVCLVAKLPKDKSNNPARAVTPLLKKQAATMLAGLSLPHLEGAERVP